MTHHPKRRTEMDPPIKRRLAGAQPEKPFRQRHLADVKALLEEARRQLRTVMQDETIMAESPLEAQCAMESAAEFVGAALVRLESVPSKGPPSAPPPGAPTRPQGQPISSVFSTSPLRRSIRC
jgi:hypothetical protein